MKTVNIFYWITTGLLCLWMLFQAVMFIFYSDAFHEMFNILGMPLCLIIPLGVAKLLAIIAILSNLSPMLKQLAYAGLTLDFIAAIGAHLNAQDGKWIPAAIALGLLAIVVWLNQKRNHLLVKR